MTNDSTLHHRSHSWHVVVHPLATVLQLVIGLIDSVTAPMEYTKTFGEMYGGEVLQFRCGTEKTTLTEIHRF